MDRKGAPAKTCGSGIPPAKPGTSQKAPAAAVVAPPPPLGASTSAPASPGASTEARNSPAAVALTKDCTGVPYTSHQHTCTLLPAGKPSATIPCGCKQVPVSINSSAAVAATHFYEPRIPASVAGSSWFKHVKKNRSIQKALDICTMVDGVLPSDKDADTFFVYSHSASRRTVDLLLCTCDCPNPQPTCSHILAAAMFSNLHGDYLGKMVIMTKLSAKVYQHSLRKFPSAPSGSISRALCRDFMRLVPSEGLVAMLLEIIAGHSYRFHYERMLRAADPLHGSVSAVPCHLRRKVKYFDRIKAHMPASFPTSVSHLQIRPHGERIDYDSVFDLSRTLDRMSCFMRTIAGAVDFPASTDAASTSRYLRPFVERMLHEEYCVDSLDYCDLPNLYAAISLSFEAHRNEHDAPFVMDGYALGFDFLTLQNRSPRLQPASDTYAGLIQQAAEKIRSLPWLSDIYTGTDWAFKYHATIGPILSAADRLEAELSSEMIFVRLGGRCIIKVPAPQKFVSAEDLVHEMVGAAKSSDPRGFVAHGITLLAKARKIASLPPTAPVIKALNQIFSGDLAEAGACFVAQCVDLLPSILLLAFSQAFLIKTAAFSTASLRMVVLVMNERLIRREMGDTIQTKMLKLEEHFNIPVAQEWSRAKRLALQKARESKQARSQSSEPSEPSEQAGMTGTAAAEARGTKQEGEAKTTQPAEEPFTTTNEHPTTVLSDVAGETVKDPILTSSAHSEVIGTNVEPADGAPTAASTDAVELSSALGEGDQPESSTASTELAAVASGGEIALEGHSLELSTENSRIPTDSSSQAGAHEEALVYAETGMMALHITADANSVSIPLSQNVVSHVPPNASYPLSPAYAKILIDEIRRTEFGVGLISSSCNKSAEQQKADEDTQRLLDKQRRRLARSIKRLSEDIYNTRTHLQLELIQNADDNEYDALFPEIVFLLDPEAIVVLNNERGFTEENVRSLCDIGHSSKVGKCDNKIGKFGIGFKSVFAVTQSPYIFSNGFSFMFSSDPNLENNTEYIMPHWVDVNTPNGPAEFVSGRLSHAGSSALSALLDGTLQTHVSAPGSIIYLPLLPKFRSGLWKEYYREFQAISHLHLTFLRKVTAITFIDVSEGVYTRLLKSSFLPSLQRMRIKIIEPAGRDVLASGSGRLVIDNTIVSSWQVRLTTQWRKIDSGAIASSESMDVLLLESTFSLDGVREAFLVSSRDQRRDCTLSVGIPLFSNDMKSSTYNVYNGLPIADYGLPFLLDGSFVVSASRQSVVDDPWNSVLAERAAGVFISALHILAHQHRSNPTNYRSALYAIPEENCARGCFELCCETVRRLLRQLPWVALEGSAPEYCTPGDVFLPPATLPAITAQHHLDVLQRVLPAQLLRDYCGGLVYATAPFHEKTLRDTLIGLGMEDLDGSFILKVVKGVRVAVDTSVPLSSQPPFIQQFLSNIGVLLCIFDRVAEPEYMDDVRRWLVLLDAKGYPMTIHAEVMFIRDTAGLDVGQLPNLVSPSLFTNVWGIDGYANRIASVLVRMGCIEITPSNFLSTTLSSCANALLSIEGEGAIDEILKHGKNIIHTMAVNVGKLDTLDADCVKLLRSMPVLVEDGEVLPAHNMGIRFSPSSSSLAGVIGVDMRLRLHYSAVRSFFADVGLRVRYLSDKYLDGVGGQSTSGTPGVKFDDFVKALNHLGIYTFLNYRFLDLDVDSVGKYDLPYTSLDSDGEAIGHCRRERNVDMVRMALFGGCSIIRDWCCPNFAQIAMAMRQLYAKADGANSEGSALTSAGSNPQLTAATVIEDSGNIGGTSTHVTSGDSEKAELLKHAHKVAISMYRIMDREIEMYPEYLSATISSAGSSAQVIGRSFLYYQLRNTAWLPYKEAFMVQNVDGSSNVEWRPVAPIALEDDIAFPSIVFKKLDADVTNQHLRPTQELDLLESLNFICGVLDSLSGDSPRGVLNGHDSSMHQSLFTSSNAQSLERFERCFSRSSFQAVLQRGPAEFMSFMGSLYLELYHQMSRDKHMESRVRTYFKCSKLIVFVREVEVRCGAYRPEIGLYSADSRSLSIYKCPVQIPRLAHLSDSYLTEFPQLSVFWAQLGISEFLSVEETLLILDEAVQVYTVERMALAHQCLLHLYNMLDHDAFVNALWERRCIAVKDFRVIDCGRYSDDERARIRSHQYRFAKPSSGLVTAISVLSKATLSRIASNSTREVLIVIDASYSAPLGPHEEYYKRFMAKVGLTEEGIWSRMLSALKATESTEHCWISPLMRMDKTSKFAIHNYVMIPLMPYVHNYVRCCMRDSYGLICDRLPSICRRLSFCCERHEMFVSVAYHDGATNIFGRSESRNAALHCADDGTIWLYLNISKQSMRLESNDMRNEIPRLSIVQRMADIPREFFLCLAKALLADPADPPHAMNCKFFSTTHHETELSNLLFTVFELLRKESLSAVETFMKSFNSRFSDVECLCKATKVIFDEVAYEANYFLYDNKDNGTASDIEGFTWSRCLSGWQEQFQCAPASANGEQKVDKVIAAALAMGRSRSPCEFGGDAPVVFDVCAVPNIPDMGTHIPGSATCKKCGMDPFVFIFLSREKDGRDYLVALINGDNSSPIFGSDAEDGYIPLSPKSDAPCDVMDDEHTAVAFYYDETPAPCQQGRASELPSDETATEGDPLSHMIVLNKDLGTQASHLTAYKEFVAAKYITPNMSSTRWCPYKLDDLLEEERRRIVGRTGEDYVQAVLKQMLKLEISAGDVEVHWHNSPEESGRPYDISIRSPDGEETFIEVKSSSRVSNDLFNISTKEWLFAQQMGARYEIFRLSGVGMSRPSITRLMNPYVLWKNGKLRFCLSM